MELKMPQVWEVWNLSPAENVTNGDARARLEQNIKNFRASSGAEVKVMRGGYGDFAGSFIVMIKHGGFEDFAKSAAKVNSDEKLKAQNEETLKNPKLKWVRAGLLIEEDI
jgi:hypothetical protein